MGLVDVGGFFVQENGIDGMTDPPGCWPTPPPTGSRDVFPLKMILCHNNFRPAGRECPGEVAFVRSLLGLKAPFDSMPKRFTVEVHVA